MSKVTFDPINSLIIVNYGETEIDAQIDLYSDWKEWIRQSDNSKYLAAFRTTGGDPLVGTQFISPYFFLTNGWRIRPHEADHLLTIEGSIFVDGGGNLVVPTVGNYTVLVTVLSSSRSITDIVTSSGIEASVSDQDKLDIADRVWDETLSVHQGVGSTGEALYQSATASGLPAEITEQDKLDIADRVWDETLADHQDTGSTGEALDSAATASGISVNADEIADAVWDEQLSEHQQPGSAGEGLATASGIQQVDTEGIADAVWDEAIADHQGVGSTGEALDAASTASGVSVNVDEIADAVWDELVSGHSVVGSFGAYISTIEANVSDIQSTVGDIETYVVRTLGLTQENYYLDQMSYTTYSGIKLLTNGRIRIYSVPGSVGTSSNVIGTYNITSTWSDDQLTTYKVVKQ